MPASDYLFTRNPQHIWWVEGSCGPLPLNEYLCKACNEYMIQRLFAQNLEGEVISPETHPMGLAAATHLAVLGWPVG